MKKKLVSFLCILPIISYAADSLNTEQITPYVGSYVGIGGGLNSQFYKSDYFDATESTNHWIDFGNNGGMGELYAGYNYKLNPRFLVGADFHIQYNWTGASQHTHNNILAYDSIQLPWQLGISPKFGYTYRNNLYYVLIGPEWAKFNDKDISDTGVSGSGGKTLFGGLFGVGLSQKISENLNLVEQFSYGVFPSTKHFLSNGDSSTVQNPSEATIMLALQYYFR